MQGRKIGNIVFVKVQVLDVFDNLFQTGKYGKTTLVGIFAVKHIKYHLGFFVLFGKVAVCHSHFVQIHHHGNISFIKLAHGSHPHK